MNPEFFEYISERLFDSGASDVFLSNIMMKKGRPGVVLNVICEPEKESVLKRIIFTESTTLGVRTFPFRKDTLSREFEKINTKFGEVTVKRSFYNGIEVSSKPEYEDCRRIAAQKGLPIKEVFATIMAAISSR
jgi:uncharacterized protein (DUF111 family)